MTDKPVAVPRKKAVLTFLSQEQSNFFRFAAVKRSRGVETSNSPDSDKEYLNEEGNTCREM